jgi:hypothetical protein
MFFAVLTQRRLFHPLIPQRLGSSDDLFLPDPALHAPRQLHVAETGDNGRGTAGDASDCGIVLRLPLIRCHLRLNGRVPG